MLIRRKKIRELTLDLLKRYRVNAPPVDVEKIAEGENAKVIYQKAEGDAVSGFVYRSDATAVIGVNEDHHPNRRRFTIAHELGHLLLHAETTTTPHVDTSLSVWFRDSSSSKGDQWQEVEANLFAAELLMPAHLLEKELHALTRFDLDKDERIEHFAEHFQVSSQALLIRLANLGYLTM